MNLRECNFLEGFFIQCNVRFVIGWEIPKHKALEEYCQTVQAKLQHVHRSIDTCSDGPKLVEPETTNESSLPLIVSRTLDATTSTSLFQVVQSNRQEECLVPLQLSLYGDRFFVLNVNHALMDAITINRILKVMESETKTLEELLPWNMMDWGTFASNKLKTMQAQDGPDYLPLPGVPLKACDILGFDDNDDIAETKASSAAGDDIVICIDSDIAQNCRIQARKKSTTWTGVLVACFFRALAELAKGEEDYCLSSSILVDLRRYLDVTDSFLLQVQATVTTGRIVSEQELVESQDVTLLVPWLWKVAQESVKDIRCRIDRGEAHRTAAGLATGLGLNDISQTVELSNHGVYAASEVEVSQRFDDYTGLSVIAHSSSSTNVLKLTCSLGKDLDATKVQLFSKRVEELIKLLA